MDLFISEVFPRPPEHRFNSYHQFSKGEGLADVIVCTGLETGHNVVLGTLCGENYNGLTGFFLPNFFADGKTINRWQHHIQDNQVIFIFQSFL